MTGINIPPDALREVIAAAILRHLDGEARESIMQGAIAYLITPTKVPKRGGYGEEDGPSPLLTAFQRAADAVATEVAHDYLRDNDDVKAKLRAMIEDAVNVAVTERRAQIVSSMARAIVSGFDATEKY